MHLDNRISSHYGLALQPNEEESGVNGDDTSAYKSCLLYDCY